MSRMFRETPLQRFAIPDTDGDGAGQRAGALDRMLANVARFLGSELVLCCALDHDGRPRTLIGSSQPWSSRDKVASALRSHAVGREAVLESLDPAQSLPAAEGAAPLTHVGTAPVRLPGGLRAALLAGLSTLPTDWEHMRWALESCAAMVALYVHEPASLDALLEAARPDALTGCLSYADTCSELAREINRSTREELALSVCFLDIDDFKQINDRDGHLRGNEVLAMVARVLRQGVRSCDTVGRFGGDEFIAILPQTREAEAMHMSARLRMLIAAQDSGLPRPISVSIGVAEWTPGTTPAELLACADAALLEAKPRQENLFLATRRPISARFKAPGGELPPPPASERSADRSR